jgi:ABC-type glycerol-3-phosphate transport system substrate-binding protein
MRHLLSVGCACRRHGLRALGLLTVLALILSACTGGTPGPSGTPAVSATSPTATPSPASRTTAATTAEPVATAPATSVPPSESTEAVLALTWWTPEFYSPQAPQPAGPLLAEQLAAFEASQGGQVRVNPILKARYGEGGLLDFLLTAQPVAPAILPDLITLDVTELEMAVEAGLLQPLDLLLDGGVTTDLYPFARSAGFFDDRRMSVQHLVNLEHVAYLTSQVEAPPATWDMLLEEDLPYLFPLGNPQPSSASSPTEGLQHAVLSQYYSTGVTVDSVTRAPLLELEPLIRLLEFYDAAAEAGVLPPGAQELTEPDAVWGVYVQGKVPLAYVSARRYLAEREALRGSGYAAAPGWAGPAAPIADGWALAIVTTDPERQRAAAALIAWLMRPENSAAWAQAAGWLPTHPAALSAMRSTTYHQFLDSQLRVAISPPIGPDYVEVVGHIQRAIASVLQGEVAPAEAAQQAVNAQR